MNISNHKFFQTMVHAHRHKHNHTYELRNQLLKGDHLTYFTKKFYYSQLIICNQVTPCLEFDKNLMIGYCHLRTCLSTLICLHFLGFFWVLPMSRLMFSFSLSTTVVESSSSVVSFSSNCSCFISHSFLVSNS